jgi:cytosine/adenosine deaminase-related metal-dependent hydrolase
MAKTTRPTIRIHDLELNEIIDREMNDAEFEQYETEQAERLVKQAEAEAKEAQRQAILNRLGISAEELKTILG